MLQESDRKWQKRESGWCSGLGVGFRSGRARLKSPLNHNASWVTLGQYSLSASPISKDCCEDKKRKGTMYAALSSLVSPELLSSLAPGSKPEMTFWLLMEACRGLLRSVEAQDGLQLCLEASNLEGSTQDPPDFGLQSIKWVTINYSRNPGL